MSFLKSIGVGLDRLEATRGGLEASFSDFLSFLAIFGLFWPFLTILDLEKTNLREGELILCRMAR